MKSIEKNINEKKSNKKYYILSFLLPMIAMLIAYIALGVYPFGEKSILTNDMLSQYSKFYATYKEIFSTGNFSEFLYSWKLGLGGNFVGLFSYYLASPLSFLILLFPKENIPEVLMGMTILKLGLSGLTFNMYLKYKFKKINIYNVICSTMYALISFSIVFSFHIMWLDAIVLLPLVLIGVEKIINENKFIYFTIVLIIMFIANFYMSYMIGGFSFLYFIAILICKKTQHKWKFCIKSFTKFILGTVLAVGCVAFLVLPTYFAIKSGGGTDAIEFLNYFKFKQFATRFYLGTYDTLSYGTPNVYCGLLSLILIIPFILNRKIKLKQKIVFLCLLAFIVLSFSNPFLDLAWHAFDTPNWFLYRYSYLFSFLVVLLAYMSLINIEGNKIIDYIVSSTIFIGLICYLNKVNILGISKKLVAINIMFIISYFIILILIKSCPKWKVILTYIMLVAVFLEGTLSSTIYVKRVDKELTYANRDVYTINKDIKNSVDYVNLNDKSFYRMEQMDQTYNEGLKVGYNSLSLYSSLSYQPLNKFLSKLGIENCGTTISMRYSGSTHLLDSILGIKYIMSSRNIGEGYDLQLSGDNINLYLNKNVLPLGVATNKEIINSKIYSYLNYFEIQNELFNLILGNTKKSKNYIQFFDELKTKMFTENLTVDTVDSKKIFTKNNKDEEASITFNIKNVKDKSLYMQLNNDINTSVKVYKNDEYIGNYGGFNDDGILNLGTSENDNVQIKLVLTGDKFILNNSYFKSFNYTQFQEELENMKNYSMKDLKVENTKIIGHIQGSEERNTLLLMVPYDKGWSAYIDGEKVEIEPYKESFMSIPLKQGEQKIEFKFFPQGLKLGLSISSISAIVLILILIKNKIKKKK